MSEGRCMYRPEIDEDGRLGPADCPDEATHVSDRVAAFDNWAAKVRAGGGELRVPYEGTAASPGAVTLTAEEWGWLEELLAAGAEFSACPWHPELDLRAVQRLLLEKVRACAKAARGEGKPPTPT